MKDFIFEWLASNNFNNLIIVADDKQTALAEDMTLLVTPDVANGRTSVLKPGSSDEHRPAGSLPSNMETPQLIDLKRGFQHTPN